MYLLIAHNRAVTPDIVYYYISLSSNMAKIKRRVKRFFTIILIIKFQEIIYRAYLHGRLILRYIFSEMELRIYPRFYNL